MRLANFVAAAALLVPCLALHADTLDYLFTVKNAGCYYEPICPTGILEFQLASQPTPTSNYVDSFLTGDSFLTREYSLIQNTTPIAIVPRSDDYPLYYNGFLFTLGQPYFNLGNYPGSELYILTNLPALFTGSVSAPTLLTGSGSVDIGYGSGDYVGAIAITDVTTSPVPEPSSLALLGTGLFGIVAAARRRLS